MESRAVASFDSSISAGGALSFTSMLTKSLTLASVVGAPPHDVPAEAEVIAIDDLLATDLNLSDEEEDNIEELSGVISSMVELVEVMISLRDVFTKCSRANQAILANQVYSLPGALEGFYMLFFKLFERES